MNKLKFTIIFSLTAISLYSQELDKSFLESLPEDIQEDLLNRAENKSDSIDKNYSSFLFSSKLEQVEELSKLKDRIEIDLKELERRLNSDENLELQKELDIFGSDFFNTFQTSFMPVNEPNPDSSYILDVGDVLNVQLIGQNDYDQEFPVYGDGAINLPDIGKITVAGLSLNESSALIKSKVKSVIIGAEAFISISKIRDVNILVTGNTENPGIYTLNGNSNILHALSASGGVSEFGSYREINLIRDEVIIETLDVYDLLIDGKYSLKKRLRSGDVVFVQPRKNIVTINGAVKRPAKYEITDDQFLNDVIRYANGIKITADIQTISLERILDGTLKTIPVVNKVQFDSIIPKDGDLIYIREFPYRQAKISGAVKKPGSYTMAAGETLDDLIDKAGGLNFNAYLFGAVYLNEDAKSINKKSKDILYEEFLDNIIAVSQQNISENFDLTPIVRLTSEIKNTEASGRIVVDLDNSETDESKRVQVKEGDELIIPELSNNVYVYGEISTEGSVLFSPNKDVEYFVNKSGGFKKFADVNSIYILHPNGESVRYKNKRNIFESQPKSDIKIYPGSIIFVPRELDESTPRRIAAQAYVSILGNLGIALASLSSINNNN
ncbi:MAG: SLBB domain-containing protein [Pseudomonadota bacterium]|nr:SLBB domain-containing protein [Pseudomonadota bacterium]